MISRVIRSLNISKEIYIILTGITKGLQIRVIALYAKYISTFALVYNISFLPSNEYIKLPAIKLRKFNLKR